MKKISTIIAILFCGTVLAGGVYVHYHAMERVTLNGHVFCIPRENNANFFPLFNFALPKGDNTFLLSIAEAAIKRTLPDYELWAGTYPVSLYIYLEGMEPQKAAFRRSPEYPPHANPWYGKEWYSDRIITYDVDGGYYKVMEENGSPYWTAMKILPELGKPLPERVEDFYLGSCLDSTILAGPRSGEEITKCSVSSFYGNDIFYTFDLAIENILLKDKVLHYVKESLHTFEMPYTKNNPSAWFSICIP